jgi:hypothetical protein
MGTLARSVLCWQRLAKTALDKHRSNFAEFLDGLSIRLRDVGYTTLAVAVADRSKAVAVVEDGDGALPQPMR